MAGVGGWRSESARTHFLAAYEAGMAELPRVAESLDVPTTFGTVRAYRFGSPLVTFESPVTSPQPAGRPVVLLPGRNSSTPMWAGNLPGLLAHRTVYCVDLLGEPGLSVQRLPLTCAADQAWWFGELLIALGLDSVHLAGVSFGGWSAVNFAVHHPARVASLVLLDPVMTFAPIPIRTMVAVAPMGLPRMPDRVRRRVLRWIAGGAELRAGDPVAALIDAGTADFASRQPALTRFSDAQLGSLDMPVLALIAGRSVIHDGRLAADTARKLLPHGRVELWTSASHAINGEFPDEIAARAHRFWDGVDAP
ncbi:alpha/beta fold hydrolase [Mycobacterium sp. BMJ-28]